MKVENKVKQKIIIQNIDELVIQSINFYSDKLTILYEMLDNKNTIERKMIDYDISEFGNIFDKLFKRILKDEDLKEL